MDNILIDLKCEENQEKEKCKGLVFRCRINNFLHDGRYEERVSFSVLKRKSCPGCKYCGWELEYIYEGLPYQRPILPENPVDFGLYRLVAVNMSTDEYGYVDDVDLEFVEYVENVND